MIVTKILLWLLALGAASTVARGIDNKSKEISYGVADVWLGLLCFGLCVFALMKELR